MKTRLLGLLAGTVFTIESYAFPCFLTLVKDNCWLNYEVTVVVMDSIKDKQVVSVTVPKGKNWVRQVFVCQPEQKFMFLAKFTPTIWEGDTNKTYRAQRYWSMPAEINNNETAWNIPLCFPLAFSETPLPPDATGNCRCDFSVIPSVQPQ